ncbi:hypothetical protein [Rhodoferax saidenbachensis]|uniref:MSHA biogenesis protein MshJ n=1 Tax=Rhodoferax saidenbachensis TaxID=1484693 RepID=A0ABU1ZNJ5_9BURK|nr:hypothetical protein [Rhodoferax saidenbachensis]MDR7306963.1 MSHA biogenesis protein MshJ [Rhodoferax saidenbachensis]
MKPWWIKHAARIDALSLRERVFLFLSCLACCVALAYVLWLEPAQLAHTQITQRYAAQGTELVRLREQLKNTPQPVDANKATRDELGVVLAQIDGVNQQIAGLVPAQGTGSALEQVLVQFLRRQEGLTLLGTSTLAQEAPTAAASSPSAAASSAVATPAGVSRRGLELRVSGAYPELTRYVKTLENALPTLRWGMLRLRSEKQPPELTLQVYVVGVQP